ncbi:MAG: methyltransferase domain-containing protein [Bacteroidetes bacterium]|nr:methyltransferase domain-containing protein [Bacteroidota bacterium]MBU1116633.1 methyltransferase domain-containing protein [Bacteroidota bacterium]MBU1797750.1 methyltransferase domain-containing protein [Bacteroidota bacterium]
MDNKKYYDNYNWEKAALSEKIGDKIDLIINSIPKEVKSILDVGCGDGTISNGLVSNFNILAADRSLNALKYVKTKKINISADFLPIKDNSFDLVFSSEMIEHLPDDIFTKSISEMKRVSKKYIYLTFPNDENIKKQVTECTKCSYVFNKSYHLRSINLELIKKLFPEYKVNLAFEYGAKIRDYNKVLNLLKHKFVPSSAWIPMFWTPNQKRTTSCPNCNHQYEIPYKFNFIAFVLDRLNVIISKKRPYQLCVLLEKQ